MALPVLGRKRKSRGRNRDDRMRDTHEPGEELRPAVRPWSAPPAWREPWSQFSELYERMGRLLADIDASGQFRGWWRPPADVEETADAYVVELELPGVKREDVTVELSSGELAVTGEVKERERVGLLRSRTRRVGRFDYRVSVPADIDDDQVNASLTDGVLTVRLPKTEQSRPRKIAITS